MPEQDDLIARLHRLIGDGDRLSYYEDAQNVATAIGRIESQDARIEQLQAENERLREVHAAAQSYFDGYVQDEAADDAEEWAGCTPDQHLKAKRLRLALEDVQAQKEKQG